MSVDVVSNPLIGLRLLDTQRRSGDSGVRMQKPDEATMIDEDRRNDLGPLVEERHRRESCGDGAAASVDPRIVSIARAIGRLIARERFKELTDPNRPED